MNNKAKKNNTRLSKRLVVLCATKGAEQRIKVLLITTRWSVTQHTPEGRIIKYPEALEVRYEDHSFQSKAQVANYAAGVGAEYAACLKIRQSGTEWVPTRTTIKGSKRVSKWHREQGAWVETEQTIPWSLTVGPWRGNPPTPGLQHVLDQLSDELLEWLSVQDMHRTVPPPPLQWSVRLTYCSSDDQLVYHEDLTHPDLATLKRMVRGVRHKLRKKGFLVNRLPKDAYVSDDHS